MKKFILFLFLATSLSIQNTYAQDIGDEFADPTLDMGSSSPTTSEVPPPEFQSSTTESNPIEGNFDTSNDPVANPVDVQTDFQPQPLEIENVNASSGNEGDVVVEQQTDLTESYKKRRGKHGVLFSVNYEKFNPIDYYSMYGDEYIETFLGDSDGLDLVSVELGYKLNFKLGSVSLLGNFATGSRSNSQYVEENTTIALERGLSVTRLGLSANFALDNVTEEPWIVPYGQVGVHQFDVSESFQDQDDNSTTTQFAFNYRAGLLFQLNWIEKSIDPSTQLDGLRSSGLQNTFLDLYVMTHMASSEVYDPADTSEGDPDMSTSMDIGVGLKMEF